MSDHLEPAKMFLCSFCLQKGLIEKENRACFRFEIDQEEGTTTVLVPELDETGMRLLPKTEWTREELTRREILEMLADLEVVDPTLPSFILLLHHFGGAGARESKTKEVCPTGLLSEEDVEWIDSVVALEDQCSTYHTLPFRGSLEDQPTLIMDFFAIVRAAKRSYESFRMEEVKKEAEQRAASQGQGMRRKR